MKRCKLISTANLISLVALILMSGCSSQQPTDIEYWTKLLEQSRESISEQLGDVEFEGRYVGTRIRHDSTFYWALEFGASEYPSHNKYKRPIVRLNHDFRAREGRVSEHAVRIDSLGRVSFTEDSPNDEIRYSGLILGDTLVLCRTLRNKRHDFEMHLGDWLLVHQKKPGEIEHNETKESAIETLGGAAMSLDYSELLDRISPLEPEKRVKPPTRSEIHNTLLNHIPPFTPKTFRVAFMWHPESLTKNLFKDSEKDNGLHVQKKAFDGSASITQCEASFQSGRLDGKTIWYYPSGNLSQVQYFDSDVRVKNWQMFRDDEGNTLMFSENFDSDSRIQKWYDARGNLEETRELVSEE